MHFLYISFQPQHLLNFGVLLWMNCEIIGKTTCYCQGRLFSDVFIELFLITSFVIFPIKFNSFTSFIIFFLNSLPFSFKSNEFPNFSTCEFHQKLQMLQCCINTRLTRFKTYESLNFPSQILNNTGNYIFISLFLSFYCPMQIFLGL